MLNMTSDGLPLVGPPRLRGSGSVVAGAAPASRRPRRSGRRSPGGSRAIWRQSCWPASIPVGCTNPIVREREEVLALELVSTVKKSQATMLFAWRRKNSRHERSPRWPAGPRPASTSSLRTLVAESSTPGQARSPTIRWWPQRGFSRASRRTRDRISAPIRGRPGSPTRICPLTGDHPTVPQKQSLRRDEERRPAPSRERSTGRSEKRTIDRLENRPCDRAPQGRELVAEHDDLELLLLGRAGRRPRRAGASNTRRSSIVLQ